MGSYIEIIGMGDYLVGCDRIKYEEPAISSDDCLILHGHTGYEVQSIYPTLKNV